jgi:hypothetical protein
MAALSCFRAIENERTATREECEEKRRELEQSLVCFKTYYIAQRATQHYFERENTNEICLSEA